MKRLFSILLALLLAAALTPSARADILWEPSANYFYERHRSQCAYENRGYRANGPEGFVTLLDAPGGSQVRSQFKNGEKLWIYYLYDGGAWGLAAYGEDGREISGWVPMESLSLVYDFQSFQEEYGARITPYGGEFADYQGTPAAVNFFEYPGAAEVKQRWETGGQWRVLENLTGTAEADSYISSVFVDEEGRTWGFVGYMYGRLNGWFCLDQPDGEDFPLREVDQPELIPARQPVLPATGYVPYLLVAAAVLATAAALVLLYGKKRGNPTE